MTLRPQNVSQSVRLKHPDGLESASRRPLRGIRAHSATSPKRRSRCWSRRPAARGGSRPPPVEEGITSRFFCGRQPCRLIAPLSSEGMPFLTVGFADNRTFCPAVAKTCDYPQAAGAAKLLSALFPCQTPKNRELCPLCGLVCARIACFVLKWPKQAILRTGSQPPGLRTGSLPRDYAVRLLCAIVPLLCRYW